MSTETIYTLDARDNVFLEVLKKSSNLTFDEIYTEINNSHENCILLLSNLKIKYADLKNALIPRSGRNEAAFVFDINKIQSSSYGHEVFSKLIPLLEKKSDSSILGGDFIGNAGIENKLKQAFLEHIQSTKEISYINHRQFFIVYLNNLPDTSVRAIDDGLKAYSSYVGFFDLTYSSFLKIYLSTILSRLFLKHKTVIITPYESTTDNMTIYSYPFEENGYKCKTIQEIYYNLFLGYKIEREIFSGFESDASFSINALTMEVSDIFDFNLFIEEKKLGYLLKEKADSIIRAGITNLTLPEIEQLIKDKMRSNYIYNLSFLPETKTIKFNILIETKRVDSNKPMKLTVALEYMAEKKTLRLITMF